MQAVSNHPNRSKASPSLAANPSPATIRAAREAAGLSQTDAAALIHCGLRAWQEWEAGARRMHPAFWELWLMKAERFTGEHQ
jgi:putative transcriptional regulator